MSGKTRQIIQVVLGVVIGALITLSVVRYRDAKHLINTRYADWRKLNLVLDMVEKNYVDTLNREGMTDAAIVAALSKLFGRQVIGFAYPYGTGAKQSAEALKAAGVRTEATFVPEGGHGMGMYAEENLQKMVGFLKEAMSKKK